MEMASTLPSAENGFQTLTEVLRHRAQHSPDTAAYVFRDPVTADRHVLTFLDLYQLGGRWASVLHARGIGRGQRVVTLLLNSPERAVVNSALLIAGTSHIQGFCGMKDASDLKAILNQSSAVAIILDPDIMPDVYTTLLHDVIEPKEDGSVSSQSLPSLKFMLLVRRCKDDLTKDFMACLRANEREFFCEHQVSPHDMAFIAMTSGTTGMAKLVPVTHHSCLLYSKTFNNSASFLQFHIGQMGWISSYLGPILLAGQTRVLYDARAGRPDDLALFIYRSVKEEGLTTGLIPFYIIPDLVKIVETLNNGQPIFECLSIGSQPVTKKIVKEAFKLAHSISTIYGSTEMKFVSYEYPVDVEKFEDYLTGKVITGVDVNICNEEGENVKAGTRGEVLVKTPDMFDGYLGQPEATAAAFTHDGYFRTGDVGWMDEDGNLFVEGRSKDVFVSGARYINPAFLEAKILECPAVRDVIVVGVPDVMLINKSCACIILKSDDWSIDDVKQYVENYIFRECDMLSIRPDHYIQFHTFPLTVTGKPRRVAIQKMAEEKLAY